MLKIPQEVLDGLRANELSNDKMEGYINATLSYNKLQNTEENRDAAFSTILDILNGNEKYNTTDLNQAIQLWGKDNIGAGVKCTYAELYLENGTKIFSLQGKALRANTGNNVAFIVKGIKVLDTFKGKREMVEVMLTRSAYDYLCTCIENAIKYFGGIGENYADIVNYLFIRNINGNLERSYRPVSFYVPPVALRYYFRLALLNSGGSTAQDTIVSNYEQWQAEQDMLLTDTWQQKQELKEKRNKLLLLLSGVALLFKFS